MESARIPSPQVFILFFISKQPAMRTIMINEEQFSMLLTQLIKDELAKMHQDAAPAKARITQAVDEALKRNGFLAEYHEISSEEFMDALKNKVSPKGNRYKYYVGKTSNKRLEKREEEHNAEFMYVCHNNSAKDADEIEKEADKAEFDAGTPGNGGNEKSTVSYCYKKDKETKE